MNAAGSKKAARTRRERGDGSLDACVRVVLARYLKDLDGHDAGGIHHLVMEEVEQALLDLVMEQVQGNQTRAAELLGINRSTLRKKLRQYETY